MPDFFPTPRRNPELDNGSVEKSCTGHIPGVGKVIRRQYVRNADDVRQTRPAIRGRLQKEWTFFGHILDTLTGTNRDPYGSKFA